MAAHASKIFKAVASDPNATKDTKDPVGGAEEDKDDLDKFQDCLLSSKIVTGDSVANHEVAKGCNSHRGQPIPGRMTYLVFVSLQDKIPKIKHLSLTILILILIQALCHPGSKSWYRQQRQGLCKGWRRKAGEGVNG